MKTITVKVPDELYNRMRRHKEINWSEIIRNAIKAELDKIENVSTGSEIIERLKKLGVEEKDLIVEPPQGEEEFQKELKRKSMIQMF
ncbi:MULTISPECIES: hypothetical protein [Sulfurisphaera]|uniref:Ribbon-helix-helix protein CopG domain-containing protein n=3 Tax=Sulfurisphaera TaxID=69655 RepID=Q971S3_SULTO|nr:MULTISPECIES: hypothetical protein [Sulfurisphaera]MBB5252500.1 post-segregation antitoxin (ccd killing protein) [Sulfurisphaera ohwakuensis]QGR17053.1 hypothetical protein D1869_07550 [Sulfurisphaera ohwakuensis]BAB66347.1 hypothetical protein STK_13017 [Sulfurisphaera tokodaii str. 7]HII73331.1 hypothetical protein [Sulfurisphaera tokodaii]